MDTPLVADQDFTCERCGYQYKMKSDYQPHLCKRCTRWMAKQTWKMVHQIQPPLSSTIEPKV